jgi:tetratricopeptide (TPR) repeat protein
MDYDIFFSYPHKDAQEVQQILQALKTEGLNVWIDKSEISDYASITNSIVEGLAHSKVLLTYYSQNYWRSRACQWELTAGFLAAQREGDPRKRVLVINPDEKAEHIHPVELRDELFQKAPKDAEALKKLVLSVKNHVSGIKSAIGDIHALTKPSWYPPGMGTSYKRFVGRLPDMWRINSALHASVLPVITGAVGNDIVQLQGMGGLGKSLLAEEYALRYAAAFSGGVFWLRAFGNDDSKAAIGEEREAERIRQINDFAIKFDLTIEKKSPEEVEAALARKLESRGKPFLWVVDDVPSGMKMEDLKKWFAPQALGKTLITTRTKEYSLGTLIPLGVLEPEEAYELLTSWRKPAGKKDEDAVRLLINDIGRHSLAVEVAGAALKASEGLQSFAEYREELASPTSDELELAVEFVGTLPTGHEKSIASTLLRSIKQLGQEGWDFLRLASVLAVAPIPASLVSSVFSRVDGLDEAGGKKKAKIALFQAEKLSLAERSEEEAGARTVHTLISRTVRFRDTTPERVDKILACAVSVLIEKLSVIKDDMIHSELKLEISHARYLVSRGYDIQIANLMNNGISRAIRRINQGEEIQIANLISYVAKYDMLQGAYKSAGALLRREYDIRNLNGHEHRDTLTTMNEIAVTLRAQGDLEGARKINEQVLEISRRTLGEEHPVTLNTMNNLAEQLRAQGDLEGARKIHEQVLETSRRTLGEEHPNTLGTMNNLAETLRTQGDLDGARKIHEKVLEITRITLGEEHPNTLGTMNNLAETLRTQGDLDGARKIHEKVLEISRRTLGEEHPNTSLFAWNLFQTLLGMGDIARAIDILKTHLLWLLDWDPASLEENQQQIREMIIQEIGGSAGAEGASPK